MKPTWDIDCTYDAEAAAEFGKDVGKIQTKHLGTTIHGLEEQNQVNFENCDRLQVSEDQELGMYDTDYVRDLRCIYYPRLWPR